MTTELETDETILTDIDAVIEQVSDPEPALSFRGRTFEQILNEWTDTLLEVNREVKSIEAIAAIARVGLLGQRLIFESNDVGMRQVMQMTKERLAG